jgi:WD40 repeat protein
MDKTVKLWDANHQQNMLTLRGGAGLRSAVFSPDGKQVVSGSGPDVIVHDSTSGQEVLRFKGHGGFVNVAFSPDGKWIVGPSNGNTLKAWDAHSGKELFKLDAQTISFSSFAFSLDGQRIAVPSSDNSVKI